MKSQIVVLAVAIAEFLVAGGLVQANVFNMPEGQTSLEFVTVGDRGNTADSSTGYGSVPYTYQMGKYDVTAAQYCQFLNAVAKTDTYGLYNAGTTDPLGFYGSNTIQRSSSSGDYIYSVASDWANLPVNFVSWGDAARYANWLSNSQPTGSQGLSTTEDGSYYLNGATTDTQLMAVTRKANATYVIPNDDEWYKAAYYKSGGTNVGYWTYPTRSNTVPSNVLSSTGSNNANYWDYYGTGNGTYTVGSPYYRTEVGAFTGSPSPYGAYDMGGNVGQWLDGLYFDNQAGWLRSLRGGSWFEYSWYLASSGRYCGAPTYLASDDGFRITLVPEPSTFVFFGTSAIGLLGYALQRRYKRSAILAVSLMILFVDRVADAEVFLYDNFNNGTATGWTEYDGSFAVEDGAYHITSNNGDWSNNNDARAFCGSTSWSDYRVDLDYKIINTGVSNWPTAFLFHVEDMASGVDNEHAYQFQLGPNILGFAKIYGTSTERIIFKEVNVSLSLETWHHLRLDISGATGTAYLDGNYIMTYDGFTDYSTGAIALKSINGGSTLFDNVLVQSVPEPSTLVLLGVSAIGLICYSLRRQRKLKNLNATILVVAMVVLAVGNAWGDSMNLDFNSGPGSNFTVFNAHGDTGETVYAQAGGLFDVATGGPNLRMSKSADDGTFQTDGNLGAGIRSTFKLVGDFIVTVDFTLNDFPPPTQSQGLNAAILAVFSDDDQIVGVERYRLDNTMNFIELYGSNGVGWGSSCSLTNGCFQLQRTGATITGRYSDGENSPFTTIYSDSGYSQPLGVELAAIQGRNAFNYPRSTSSMDISFDNLSIQADGIESVPEPSTIVLLGIGAIGLIGYAWRWRLASN